MDDCVILLSVPGLRAQDLSRMPHLRALAEQGDTAPLVPSFPALTWPVQTNFLTGQLAAQHGVVANGFYWRDQDQVEMWTAGNECITSPQIWEMLRQHDAQLTSAVWFPMLSKRASADYVCMPAPVHNPDGTESLWCYTQPTEFYGELLNTLGHFPLQHFWGPLANIDATSWIAQSATIAASQFHPRFFFIYLPHLDYAAQKLGPNSRQAHDACRELDHVLAALMTQFAASYAQDRLLWLVASEYAIVDVSQVVYPNRLLRQAGFLEVSVEDDGERLATARSRAWTLVDHQLGHVFVREEADLGPVADLFRKVPGIAEVLVGEAREKYALDHERSGEIVLVSEASSWQAYYWWLDDRHAPPFAHTVDIHRKPGYDPVELHWDAQRQATPLDATLVQGSHGAPAVHDAQRGVLIASQKGVFVEQPTADTDLFEIVLRQYGI